MEYFALIDRQMVVRSDGAPLSADCLSLLEAQCDVTDRFTETANGIEVVAMGNADVQLPDGYEWRNIREAFAQLGTDGCFHLARAKALIEWRANTKFCGRCGHAFDNHPTLTARLCPHCGNLVFPRIEPCIIVVVSRADGKILLAKHVQRNQDIYACIAGFMEAGETAEQAVRREIREETGLEVQNIRYFGSQSWPFPSQLMLGFTAEYKAGDIHLQTDELADARWFDRDSCPASPQPGSIAHRLIHDIK
ncbi:MAG: NAD(+) diphosphatase [Bacteroidales bacterium]|nr:NAD(+) diphosphatase [Candidatus Liminaster caballi]